MQSIHGVFDGNLIKPLERISAKANSKVIITFIEEEQSESASSKTKDFLRLFGSWEDSRSSDEIVNDIYASRQQSGREIEL